MAEEKFEPGAVVQLKSGGPSMTVESVRDNGKLWCKWFVGTDLKADAFSPESVRLYSPPQVFGARVDR